MYFVKYCFLVELLHESRIIAMEDSDSPFFKSDCRTRSKPSNGACGPVDIDPPGTHKKQVVLVRYSIYRSIAILVNVRYRYLMVSRYFDISNDQTILGRYFVRSAVSSHSILKQPSIWKLTSCLMHHGFMGTKLLIIISNFTRRRSLEAEQTR